MADDNAARLKRRFYETADVVPDGAAFAVVLDGRPLRTPGGVPLALESRALARAIADEWAAQEERIRPHTMPLMQMAATALERIARERAEIERTLVAYGETDLLCYRAEAPEDLARRQHETWQPVLDWLAADLGIVLETTTAMLARAQPRASIDALARRIAAFDDFELAGCSVLAQAMTSVALALAVAEGVLTASEAASASQLDERYQAELWGQDREAEARLRSLRDDIAAAGRFLDLHRNPGQPLN